ncbi:MAG TPA: hypothetical protein VN643_17925 [Pyrinomonadaceae bacterium]|nr:hypothetical protein [Pyrinomonadaceae bacterium]
MKHSFEYCALRYLLAWETDERELHAAMTNRPSPLALRSSMQHFRIARSFKGVAEEKNANLILNALDRVVRNRTSSQCDNVMALATEFQNHFGKFNVSAASKLLWLTFRSPYIIYDARAVAALRLLSCEFDNKDYPKYYEAWHSRYDQHKVEIERGCGALNNGSTILHNLARLRRLASCRYVSTLVSRTCFRQLPLGTGRLAAT